MSRKVLVASDPQMCFLSEGILCGLWENSDYDIYEWSPWKHVRGGVDEGYDLPGNPRGGYTCPVEYLSNPLPQPTHTREEILDIGCNFDLIVLLSYRDYTLRGAREYFAAFPNPRCPVVICDGEDSDWINTALIREFHPDVYFKRELVKEEAAPLGFIPSLHCSIYPLPFSAFTRSYPENIDDSVKEYDLFLSVGNTYPTRMTLVEEMVRYAVKNGLRHYIATNDNTPFYQDGHPLQSHMSGRLDWQGYMRKQAQSRITASVRGYGRDALHAWEAFSFATGVLYADPGIYIPFPFTPDKNCFSLADDLSNLDNVLSYVLWPENDELLRAVAQAGKEHCRAYHTNFARAKYMVELAGRAYRCTPIDLAEFGIEV